MLGERGVSVDHSTIYRWVQRYAPEIEKRLRWQWREPRSTSWRVDETYVKVRGQWAYLYRAVDKLGNTIEFYLSPTRNTAAAKRFLGKALNGLKSWETPTVINTDKAPTYAAALAELKKEGWCPVETLHRQVKYLNNVIEADHGKLKQLIRPVRGFKTMKTAYATIKGFEVMRALRKGRPQPSTSPAISAARPASSSAPSALAHLPWSRRSSFSTPGSRSKRLDRQPNHQQPYSRACNQALQQSPSRRPMASH
jgi:transposase-like protein